MKTRLIAALFLTVVAAVLGDSITRISTVDDFIEISDNVSKGSTYKGITIFLDDDLDMSGITFKPIGNYSKNGFHGFLGTFDGQGHTISNLVINSSSQNTGLFGYSEGLSIKNVVIDASCSIASSYISDFGLHHAYIGGIIGYCYTKYGHCSVENSANMANITFKGNLDDNLFLGGIVGRLENSYSYDISARNCANYGFVTNSGGSWNSFIGGIVGHSGGISFTHKGHIQNCLNYGDITYLGTTTSKYYYIYMGGIVGYSRYSNIENCVDYGETKTSKTSTNIGNIVGCLYYSSLSYCYKNSLINYGVYGTESSSTIINTARFGRDFELTGTVSIGEYSGTSLVEALNAYSDYYSTIHDYSRWLIIRYEKPVSFTVNNVKLSLTMNYKIIILPSLASKGSIWFDGWYTDSDCTTLLVDYKISTNTDLYGKWEEDYKNYTVTFNTQGGTPIDSISAQFGSYVILPDSPERESCTFVYWGDKYRNEVSSPFTMPAHNVTLYAVWKCTHIASIDDFIVFLNFVNSGSTYEGTTVFLDDDIDVSGIPFEPIGKNSDNDGFQGTFDGQGHTISNITIHSSSLEYVGLFGYSEGLTIKNLVMDASCFIENSLISSKSNVFMGGLIGYCYTSNRACNIENSVNMARITFNGNLDKNLFHGGIVGYFHGSTCGIRNCANYGSITHSGSCDRSYVGGIVGDLSVSSSSNRTYIQNCLNYGVITHNGKTTFLTTLYIGGIAGYSGYTDINNCVNYGNITSIGSSAYIGSVAGYLDDSSLSYCYWNENISYDAYGYTYEPLSTSISNIAKFNSDFELNGTISIGKYKGTSLVEVLNTASDYYAIRDYSHWLFNKNEKSVSFTVNSKKSFTISYKILLLPSFASEMRLCFDGWYTDSACTTLLTDFAISTNTDLYGKWEENYKNYTVTFDTQGGSPIDPISAQYLSSVTLPIYSTQKDCEFYYWRDELRNKMESPLTMPAHNITLYAVWICAHIANTDDFIDFSNYVKSGINYTGTTVFLDDDLDMSGIPFEPIGSSSSYGFESIFDGQGHIISNLVINSTSRYAGLFGYSYGLTIKNVVIDASCSIVNSFVDSITGNVCVGGFIGYCSSEYGPCNIENNINMASVSFIGNAGDLYIGGIIGFFQCHERNVDIITMKNCANYGSVTHSGSSSKSYIGGIIGRSESYSTYHVSYIHNCLNYGVVTHSGSTRFSSDLYIGGIVGGSVKTALENCVSYGNIISNNSGEYIGSIAGELYQSSSLLYCYWNENIKYDFSGNMGSTTPTINIATFNSNFELNKTVSIGGHKESSLIEALNAYSDNYATENGYSHWLLNKNGNTVSFTVNSKKSFTMNYKLISVPSFGTSRISWFDGWYTDSACTTPLTDFVINTNVDLYGKWKEDHNTHTITFDTRGGTPIDPISAQFGSDVILQDSITREQCTFAYWKNEHGNRVTSPFVMPAHNVTLYAVWKCTHITNADDLVDLSDIATSGDIYYGTTVFLDNDLDMSGIPFEPIGKNTNSNGFLGTFDGQGHVISNLEITSSIGYVGLFGYSYGLTIKNVVMDASCSVVSSFVSYGPAIAHIGGFLGACIGNCDIENSVNMASVTFNGDVNYNYNYLYLGGVAGYLHSYYRNSTVKNCANYGSVIQSGGSIYPIVGGVVGRPEGSSCTTLIQNCLNYGAIIHNGTTSGSLSVGGIAGYVSNTVIENCVSSGIISTTTEDDHIKSITGYYISRSEVIHCFFTSDVGYEESEATLVTIDRKVMDKLNSYSATKSWSNWTMLYLNGGSINDISQENLVANSKHFPDPVKKGKAFKGWFKDSKLSEKYDPREADRAVDVYAKYEKGEASFVGIVTPILSLIVCALLF